MPHLPISRRQALVLACALLLLLVVGGRLLIRSGAAAAPVALPPPPVVAPPPPPPVVVDVVGAVRRPGLYRLAGGGRIADAVARAGGATAKADLEQVNLAAPVADGQQIVVPRRVAAAAGAGAAGSGGSGATGANGP